MSILDYFKSTKAKSSATLARERLQIIVSHQRTERTSPDYLPVLQKELIQVISKYVDIDPEQVKVDFSKDSTHSVLELNIALPEQEIKVTTSTSTKAAEKTAETKQAEAVTEMD